MRRWLVASVLLLTCALGVSANEKRQGYCQLQTTGARVLGCTVTVYLQGTLTLATIYADNLNTPKSNPFTADPTTGLWSFYAANGRYDVNFQGGAPTISPAYTQSDLLFLDISSSSGIGSNLTFTGTSLFTGDVFAKSGRPWYDVNAFGADPTGATDSTAAIQAAINASQATAGEFSPIVYPARAGGFVYFPCGKYSVTSISLYDFNSLFGEGRCVEIVVSGTITYNHNFNSSSFCAAQSIYMRHLTLRGLTGNETLIQNGTNITTCSGTAPGSIVPIIESYWDDVWFENAKRGIQSWSPLTAFITTGIGGWNNRIENSTFHDLTEGIYAAWQDSWIVANTFQQSDTPVKIMGVANHFVKNTFYRNDYASVIDAGLGNAQGAGSLSETTYDTNHFEDSLTAQVILDGGDFVVSGGVVYRCIVAHTSSGGNQPPNASFWEVVPQDRTDVGEAILGMGTTFAWSSGVAYSQGDNWNDYFINNFWLSGPSPRTDRHGNNQNRAANYAFAWLKGDTQAHFVGNYGANTSDLHANAYGGRSNHAIFENNVSFSPATVAGVTSSSDWTDCHKQFAADTTCTSGLAAGAYIHYSTNMGIRFQGFNTFIAAASGQLNTNQGIAFVEGTLPSSVVGVEGLQADSSHRLKICANGLACEALVSLTSTDTLTNKTLTAPIITSPSTTGTDTGAETMTNKTLTAPAISNPSITGGGSWTGSPALTTAALTGLTNGTGLQLFNTTTTCTTAGSVGAVCTTGAITLPVGYSDTNYRLACTGQGATNVPIVETYAKSNTTFTLTIAALTAAAATFTSYDCIAGHN